MYQKIRSLPLLIIRTSILFFLFTAGTGNNATSPLFSAETIARKIMTTPVKKSAPQPKKEGNALKAWYAVHEWYKKHSTVIKNVAITSCAVALPLIVWFIGNKVLKEHQSFQLKMDDTNTKLIESLSNMNNITQSVKPLADKLHRFFK